VALEAQEDMEEVEVVDITTPALAKEVRDRSIREKKRARAVEH
jgi:hypothetical protein